MPNYQNSKIYSIRSYQTDDMYIGSTTQPLCRRMAGHRASYKRWLKGKGGYTSSFEILKHEDAYIELIDARPCKNKDSLRELEGGYIRNRQCVNKNVAGRSLKQYRLDNKEQLGKCNAQYYIDNKEQICKRVAQYRIDNKEKIREQQSVKTDCPCGGWYRYDCKARHMRTKKHQTYLISN